MAVVLAVLLGNIFLHVNDCLGQHQDVGGSVPFPSRAQNCLKPLEDEPIVYVGKSELYTDSLPPNGSKRYAIEAPRESLVSFFYQTDADGAELNIEAEGSVNRTKVSVVWLPAPCIYYVRDQSEVRFLVTNRQTEAVSYRFYVDISEPLADTGSKALLLEGGKTAFHLDLKKDDRALLELNSTPGSSLRIWVFVLYYEALPEMTYKLHLYRRSLYGSLYFSADLERRYFIMVDSDRGEEEFSLSSSVFSPTWSQEWFWIIILLSFVSVPLFLLDVDGIRRLDRASRSALISCYSWLGTLGLLVSVAGSFGYGAPIYMPLYYLFILSFALSLVLQIHTSYLDRRIAVGKCPSCGRNVDLWEVNYCCGRTLRNVSEAWFFLPLSFAFLFFIVSYTASKWGLPAILTNSLWIGSCGSIVGGIIAWWINRRVYAPRLWKENPRRYYIPSHVPFIPIGLLVTGILFALLSPMFIGFLLEVFLTQHLESYVAAHAPWVRIRVAPLTLSLQIILGTAVSAIALGLSVTHRIRGILTSKGSEA